MSIDSIGDFLTIIRNGIMASNQAVLAPYSKMRHQIANILWDEGFVKQVVVIEGQGITSKKIKLVLKYVDGESVIHNIKRISKPSCRMYSGIKEIKPVIGNLGISILTTNKGLLTDKQAKKNSVGGEIICTVW